MISVLKTLHTATRVVIYIYIYKVKGKDHSRTGQEGPQGKLRYSSKFSLTSALDVVWEGCGQHQEILLLILQEAGWASGPV